MRRDFGAVSEIPPLPVGLARMKHPVMVLDLGGLELVGQAEVIVKGSPGLLCDRRRGLFQIVGDLENSRDVRL